MIKAGIDIGSNSFRLIVVETGDGNDLRVLRKELITVRLAEGLTMSGVLAPAAIERGLVALAEFRKVLDRFPVQRLRLCGTEALRRAANSREFLRRADAVIGSPVEVITGTAEAALTMVGVEKCGNMKPPLLLTDVGGGSTELLYKAELRRMPALADKRVCYTSRLTRYGQNDSAGVRSCSVPLGALTLTEEYFGAEMINEAAVALLVKRVDAEIDAALKGLHVAPGTTVIGSGGTITALAALALDLRAYDEKQVHGYRLCLSAMEELRSRLVGLSVRERDALPGLQRGRGAILPAGLLVYEQLCRISAVEEIVVSDAGLLEGLVY